MRERGRRSGVVIIVGGVSAFLGVAVKGVEMNERTGCGGELSCIVLYCIYEISFICYMFWLLGVSGFNSLRAVLFVERVGLLQVERRLPCMSETKTVELFKNSQTGIFASLQDFNHLS